MDQKPEARSQNPSNLEKGPGTEHLDHHPNAIVKFNDMRPGKIMMRITFPCAQEQTIVATSISTIGAALHTTGSLTWITTSYLVTTTVCQPITGRLADAVGAKRLLVIEVWVFIVGNIIAGTGKNLTQLVAGRLITGVGAAGLLSLAVILVSHLTNERQRGSYLNLINLVFSVADAVGPIVGGGFSKSGNWRWIFLFNAPFGPVIALNLGGQSFPWSSPTIICMLCADAVMIIAFIIVENYASEPIAPMKFFAQWLEERPIDHR
ncbi:hypothetical protein H0H92_014268 [Tricholoma furcatifolium]|nr:hypothetical protein H0H92_014268 [Tricholoma furcatifolium]